MPVLNINLEADGMPDVIAEKGVPFAFTQEAIDVGVLSNRMESGKPSVMIAMHLAEDGGTVAGETSLALFLMAALAVYARHGDAGTGIKITAGE